MSTYGEKVAKYEARVRKALELGLEADVKDLKKLYYYVGRVQKKGADHETKPKDKLYWGKVAVMKNTKDLLLDAPPFLVVDRAR